MKCRQYSLYNPQILSGQSPGSALWKKTSRARYPGIPGISGSIFWMNANFQTRMETLGTDRGVPDRSCIRLDKNNTFRLDLLWCWNFPWAGQGIFQQNLPPAWKGIEQFFLSRFVGHGQCRDLLYNRHRTAGIQRKVPGQKNKIGVVSSFVIRHWSLAKNSWA